MKMNMRIIFLLTAFFFLNIQVLQAQVRDSQSTIAIPVVPKRASSNNVLNDSILKKRKADSLAKVNAVRKRNLIIDSTRNKRRIDSIRNLSINKLKDSTKTGSAPNSTGLLQVPVQMPDVSRDTIQNDSVIETAVAGINPVKPQYQTNISHKLLLQNKFINIKITPVYYLEQERSVNGKEILFYSICLLVFFLGLFKTFFYGYFNNLFRVFFNTSLRQSQLTDQLVQAKLPSLILNILFILSAGLYLWLLFTHLSPQRALGIHFLLPICISVIAFIYLSKYVLIKFMGWVAGIQYATNNYIFIIFLVNKIIGILLLPFIILLAFSNPAWINTITTISFLLLGLFFLARYVKSYGSLDKKLRLNFFHFAIYIVGGEILPLLILYKFSVDYLF